MQPYQVNGTLPGDNMSIHMYLLSMYTIHQTALNELCSVYPAVFYVATFVDVTGESVFHLLQDQPQLLDQYVQNYVSEETVEAWLISKRKSQSRLKNGDTYCKLW